MALKRQKNLLIITSSGGGGHLQAAKAKVAEALAQYPDAKIIQYDLLTDWVGLIGQISARKWDKAMKKGHVHVHERILKFQRAGDLIAWPVIFIKAFSALLKYDIDEIIDTQPMGTAAIIKALRLFSFIQKKPLVLNKIITELPTEKVIHFFGPIKRLSERDRMLLRIHSARPMGNPQKTNEFWLKNCSLTESQIFYDKLPLRPAFQKYMNGIENSSPLTITITVKSDEERNLLFEVIKKGNIQKQLDEFSFHFTIYPEDHVFTLMLGSQPAEKATLKYVQNFIKLSLKSPSHKRKTYLFVFCGNHIPKNKSLFKRVCELVNQTKNYPKFLTVIPLSFQDDTVIAPLFSRSNATFTRSGGLTSLELLSVARGQIWIHSEINKHIQKFRKKHSESSLIGMLSWEQGNTFYLQCVKDAKIISPETLDQSLQAFYS